MIDRNKILKGLEICSTGECRDCPYNSGYSTECFPELTHGALTILNETLTRLAKIADIVEGTIDHCDLDDAMDMLYQVKDVMENLK